MEGTTTTYKLHVRLGSAEFNAEGPELTVREDYQRFLEAISSPEVRRTSLKPAGEQEEAGNQSEKNGIDQAVLERVFQQDGDVVSLRLLPPESPNRAGDAAILLLYAYRVLQNLADVPVMRLNIGLRRSGISVDRVDRVIGVHSGLFMKGGTRSGGRYTLNNQGIAQAENWLRTLFR